MKKQTQWRDDQIMTVQIEHSMLLKFTACLALWSAAARQASAQSDDKRLSL
jgi:hypothetical protein